MTTPEQMKILQMLQEGTIKAEEAAKLLDALADEGERTQASEPGKVLKIKVSDKYSGAVKVNMGLPLGFARFLKDLIPASERARIESQGVDLDALFANLDSGTKGKLVDVEDVQDGHLIEIWIE
jgi:hypothetical protein